MEARSLRFAATARALGQAARAGAYVVPAFRSPPRVAGRMRTIRRHKNGSSTVSLVVKGRPWSAVVADMIEGFVAVNGASKPTGEELRDVLWAAIEEVDLTEKAAPSPASLRVVDDAA